MSSRSQCRGIQRHRYIPSQSICEGTWRYVIFVCQNLFNQRFRCSPSRDLLKASSALNPWAGKQSRQFASSNMMKKNNSVHIRVPINSSKITNQRLLFVVFIRTPPKNMQKIFRLLLWYFCTNSVKMLAMEPVLWSSYYWIFFEFVSNVTISRNISKFTIYLCNEYKLWRYFKANNECFWLRLDISQIFPCALEGINCNGMLRRRHFLVTFIVSKIESFYSNKIQTKLHWTPLWKNDVASSTGPDSPVTISHELQLQFQ